MKFKTWIDQDLCTGDGLCAEICPEVFIMQDDGLAYVHKDGNVFKGVGETVNVTDEHLDAVIESAEECPGECIYIEAIN